MLTQIREKTQGIIATFIIALIAIPFALWGVSSYFDGGTTLYVAKVNGAEITQQAYRAALEQFSGPERARIDNRQFRDLVLQGLIEQTLLTQDAVDQGLRLSDERLAQIIREAPYFQRDGRFDRQLYDTLLRREGIHPLDFEERLRRENLTGQLQRALSESAIVTDADVAAVVRLLQQQRKVSYAVIKSEAFSERVTVSPQEVEEYYAGHQDSYQIPEQVRIEYIRLALGDVGKDYHPSETEVQSAYAEEASQQAIPEKRRVSHILVKVAPGDAAVEKQALEKIQRIEKQARDGSEFAALARKQSEDSETVSRGGDLGDISRGMLPAELEQVVYRLKPGEVSQPVRSSFGYHLLKLTSYEPESQPSLASMRGKLVENLRKRKAEERFYELAEKFRTLVYEQPDNLVPAAQALDLEVQKSDWLTRSGGVGVLANPKVIEVAFRPDLVTQGRNSDAIEVNSETLVALRVVEHRPARAKPLADVRGQIERALKEERAREQARLTGAEWLTRLKQGTELKSLAKGAAFEYHPPVTITREHSQGLDRRLIPAVFTAARPEAAAAPVFDVVDLGPQGYAVFALYEVREGDPAKVDTALKERVRRQLVSRRGADYYANYRAGLKQTADIKIYQDKL